MASSGEAVGFRLTAAERDIDKLGDQDISLTGQVGMLRGEVDFIKNLLFAQLAMTGSLTVGFVIAIVTYLLTKGGH